MRYAKIPGCTVEVIVVVGDDEVSNVVLVIIWFGPVDGFIAIGSVKMAIPILTKIFAKKFGIKVDVIVVAGDVDDAKVVFVVAGLALVVFKVSTLFLCSIELFPPDKEITPIMIPTDKNIVNPLTTIIIF